MRPRSCDRGRDGGSKINRDCPLSFNEAAVLRPRKGPWRAVRAASRRHRFNEAAVLRPRKAYALKRRGTLIGDASMRPRSCDRGRDDCLFAHALAVRLQ